MSARSAACAALLLSACALSPDVARADDARAIDVAKRSFEKGQEQYKKNDLEGARLSFAQSFAAWPAIETLRVLAITELNTEHYVDAIKHFKTYAKDKNADPAFVAGPLHEFVDRCNAHLGHIQITTTPGAIVLVDGRRVFDTNEPVDVLPGEHTFALRGGAPRTVTVKAHDYAAVSLEAPATAGSTLSAPPVAVQPTAPPSVQAGAPPAETPASAGFWTARNVWAAGLAGGAVVSIGIGTGFAIDAGSKRSAFNTDVANGARASCTPGSTASVCAAPSQAASAQRTDVYGSQIAFGIAAAFAVSAGVVFFAWPHAGSTSGSGAWLAPSVGRDGGGVVAVGSF